MVVYLLSVNRGLIAKLNHSEKYSFPAAVTFKSHNSLNLSSVAVKRYRPQMWDVLYSEAQWLHEGREKRKSDLHRVKSRRLWLFIFLVVEANCKIEKITGHAHHWNGSDCDVFLKLQQHAAFPMLHSTPTPAVSSVLLSATALEERERTRRRLRKSRGLPPSSSMGMNLHRASPRAVMYIVEQYVQQHKSVAVHN